MKIEVCDLCRKEVNECNSTKVIIKDYNGVHFDFGTAFPVKRRFTGVICDECLKLLKERKHKQIPQTPIQGGRNSINIADDLYEAYNQGFDNGFEQGVSVTKAEYIEALDKQMPQATKTITVGIVDYPTCPICGRVIWEEEQYCASCGQRLDREGE